MKPLLVGFLVIVLTSAQPIKKTLIYGYNNHLVIADIDNASIDEVAFSSFESNDKGYWTYSGTPAGNAASPGRTGIKYYNLSSGNIQRSGLLKGRYLLTYWADGAATASGTNFSLVRQASELAINGWTLYQLTIDLSSDNSSITLSGSIKIDELRLHPYTAQMVTFTYDPLVGKTSQTGFDNNTLYYEYDDFNRLINVRDQSGNIIENRIYHLKN